VSPAHQRQRQPAHGGPNPASPGPVSSPVIQNHHAAIHSLAASQPPRPSHPRSDQYEQATEWPAPEMHVPSWDFTKIPVSTTPPIPDGPLKNPAIERAGDPLEYELDDRKDLTAPEQTKARPLLAVESALASEGSTLDHETRAIMEPRFGHDFSKVRVHMGTQARLATQSIGAVAFTFDRHIVLGAPSIQMAGRDLLAHELAHVLQQGDADQPMRVSHPQDAIELAAARAADAAATRRPAHLTPQPHLAGTVMRQPPGHARGYAGEQGMGFAGYPQPEWALIEGPSGAAGHGVTASGFDAVAVRVQGTFEIHLVDNKSLARAGNVSSATALTKNLISNLDALIATVNDVRLNGFARIAQVRASLAQARAALSTPGAQLPSNVRLIVTNVGGRSTGVTANLAAQGVQFRNLNAPPTGAQPAQAPPTTPGSPAGPAAQTGQGGGPPTATATPAKGVTPPTPAPTAKATPPTPTAAPAEEVTPPTPTPTAKATPPTPTDESVIPAAPRSGMLRSLGTSAAMIGLDIVISLIGNWLLDKLDQASWRTEMAKVDAKLPSLLAAAQSTFPEGTKLYAKVTVDVTDSRQYVIEGGGWYRMAADITAVSVRVIDHPEPGTKEVIEHYESPRASPEPRESDTTRVTFTFLASTVAAKPAERP
jgi:hypothetical protein